jgi:hypothetical protein
MMVPGNRTLRAGVVDIYFFAAWPALSIDVISFASLERKRNRGKGFFRP